MKHGPILKEPQKPGFRKKNVTEESHMVLTLSGNRPCWEFSCPSPTLQNLNNKTGPRAFWNHRGWGKCCTCFISQETQKPSKNEETEQSGHPGAIMYCLLQTTVFQCQSHKTKGRPRFQRKPPSVSNCKARITDEWPQGADRSASDQNAGPKAGRAHGHFSFWHFNER